MKYIVFVLVGMVFIPVLLFAQSNIYTNRKVIALLNADPSYLAKKALVNKTFAHMAPGHWGEFVKGVDEDIITNEKIIAFTFDACGGSKRGNGYNSLLIDFFRKEKVPATLFISGLWIDANFETFKELARDSLFEIENHGLYHRPCSSSGESEYGIQGTKTITDAFDEIEANAEKIRMITGRKPSFYRSSTAFTDETCVKMARMLGITIISYDVLSGDAVPGTTKNAIVSNVLEHIRTGAIIIMHFNHPESNTCKALMELVPKLREKGYRFVKLQGYALKGKR